MKFKITSTQPSLPLRYKFYTLGALYLSACGLMVGYVAGMLGSFAALSLGAIMLVGGGLIVEMYRRRHSIDQVSERLEQVSDQQDEMISDIEQMRMYVSATSKSETQDTQKGPMRSADVKPKVSKVVSKVRRSNDTSMNEAAKRIPKVPVIQQSDDDVVQYSDAVTEELIFTAIEQSSVDVFMQPVVSLPQRQMQMMEVFARLRAGRGKSLSAAQYLEIANRNKLQERIDNLLLKQSLEAIKADAKRGIQCAYMLNIQNATVKDASFMNDLVTFLRGHKSLASRLVFEVKQADLVSMPAKSLDVLKALSKLGCGISMDQVETPQINRDLMREVGVQFIKISGERLKDFAASDAGVEVMHRIQQSLSEDNISIVADRIEDERTLCEILDLEIMYGQGYLFGKPDRESVYDRSNAKKTA